MRAKMSMDYSDARRYATDEAGLVRQAEREALDEATSILAESTEFAHSSRCFVASEMPESVDFARQALAESLAAFCACPALDPADVAAGQVGVNDCACGGCDSL